MDAHQSPSTDPSARLAGGFGPENRHASTAWAVGQAVLLHVVVLALLVFGLSEAPDAPESGARGTINVDLIAPSSLSAAMQHTLSPPVPEVSAVEVPPPEPAEPEPLAEPEPTPEQSAPESIVPQAQTSGGEVGSTGAGEAFQANPDLSPQEFMDRRLRVLAIRKANRASQTFSTRRTAGAAQSAQPARVSGTPPPALPSAQPGISLDDAWRAGVGTPVDDGGLLLAYEEQLQASILHNWQIPDNVLPEQRCRVTIDQSPQGEILQIHVDELCPLQEDARTSIHDALMASQPLPHEGFETLPVSTLTLVFQRPAP